MHLNNGSSGLEPHSLCASGARGAVASSRLGQLLDGRSAGRVGVDPCSSDGSAARGRSFSAACYGASMTSPQVPGGVVHELPDDLRAALVSNAVALLAWRDITPLARNEFICWVEDAKQDTTRARRIRRTQEELQEGQRRPCCWPGCKHRERTGK